MRLRDRWVNLSTKILLDSRGPHQIPRLPHLPDTASIVAHQRVISIDDIEPLLAQLSAGEVQVAGRTVAYLEGQTADRETRPYWVHAPTFSDRAAPFAKETQRWSELSIFASGDRLGELARHLPGGAEELDQALRTLEHPFDGFSGLARLIGVADERVGMDHSASYKVVAPFCARLGRTGCSFRDRLQVEIHVSTKSIAEACDLAQSGVALDGSLISGTLPILSEAWTEGEDGWTLHANFPPPSAASVTILLRLGGFCVDRLDLTNLTPRERNIAVDVYRGIDPDLEYFHSGLVLGARPNPNGFEQAVGRLLTFLGFRVDVFGPDKRLSDSMDCIAYADREMVILPVECTTGSIDAGGKLGKLVVRANAIRTLLPEHVVQPVLATQQPRQAISRQELSRAADDHVAVLAREDLDELLQGSFISVPLLEAVRTIRAAVPEGNSGSLARLLHGR